MRSRNSFILISPNAILGCPSYIGNCIESLSGLTSTGDGHVVTYELANYIQNVTISTDYMVIGDSVYVGYDVTSTKPVGSVVVVSGGTLRIKADETI